MGLRHFFHKVKLFFKRSFGSSIPYTTKKKSYGDIGEDKLVYDIRSRLPNCKIKRNILIQTEEGNAEIDCLVLYDDKLFAIEVKHWKGRVVECGDKLIKYKQDHWTDETHIKVLSSPFKQLGRAVRLLRRQIPCKAWVNKIVYFEGSDSIKTESDDVWFDNIDELIAYMHNDGKASWDNNANSFFDKCLAADCLFRESRGCALRCIVCDDSLQFTTPSGVINKCNIRSISIKHHWWYDEVTIATKDGSSHSVNVENDSVDVIVNGCRYHYALCKLDYISLAN